jgi:hypothetical protein
VFVPEQPVGLGGSGVPDLFREGAQGSHPAQRSDAHAEIDHDWGRLVAETTVVGVTWLMLAQLRVSSARSLTASAGVGSAEPSRCRR